MRKLYYALTLSLDSERIQEQRIFKLCLHMIKKRSTLYVECTEHTGVWKTHHVFLDICVQFLTK